MEIYKVIYMSISIQKCDLYLRLRSKKTQHSEMKNKPRRNFLERKKLVTHVTREQLLFSSVQRPKGWYEWYLKER